MKEIPEEIKERVINLMEQDDDRELAMAAVLEAMMTFKKIERGEGGMKQIIVDPEIIADRDRFFHFARVYQNALLALQDGTMTVSPQVEEIFKQMSLPK